MIKLHGRTLNLALMRVARRVGTLAGAAGMAVLTLGHVVLFAYPSTTPAAESAASDASGSSLMADLLHLVGSPSQGILLAVAAISAVVLGLGYLILRVVQRERASARLNRNIDLKTRKKVERRDAADWGDSRRKLVRRDGDWDERDARDFDVTYTPRVESMPEIPVFQAADWSEAAIEGAKKQGAPAIAGMGPAHASKGVYDSGIESRYNQKADQVEVEEVADAVTQADLLSTLGMYDEAIGILTAQIRDAESSPTAWLMLFELYSRTERRAQYEALAEGFHTLFNAITPSWEDFKTEGLKHLEDYPVVIDKVQRLWGLPTCRAFLESLLYDDRGGSRQGFMINAYRDILFLIDIINMLDEMTMEEEQRRLIMSKTGYGS